MRVAVLVTSHERRETTLACLERVGEQTGHDAQLAVYLTDAGSRDGTAAAVRDAHPDVTVLERGPDLFWNSGMRESWEAARRDDADAYVWLNDDTLLDRDALARLLAAHREATSSVLVGATRDPDTGAVTYSGVARDDLRRPLSFSRVPPGDELRPVATMNGNCVLVPAVVVQRIGILDPAFTHGMGDFDYGLRARRAGFEVLLLPGTVGTCRGNAPDRDRSVAEELAHLRGPKGLPPAEWRLFARRWAGPLWPLYFASPYVRRLARRVTGRIP